MDRFKAFLGIGHSIGGNNANCQKSRQKYKPQKDKRYIPPEFRQQNHQKSTEAQTLPQMFIDDPGYGFRVMNPNKRIQVSRPTTPQPQIFGNHTEAFQTRKSTAQYKPILAPSPIIKQKHTNQMRKVYPSLNEPQIPEPTEFELKQYNNTITSVSYQ